MTYPILYSFRRCPYAIRARLAIQASNVQVVLREVVLKDKPQAMLDVSAKATVPVLVLPDGRVLDESLDIMLWALQQNDPSGLLQSQDAAEVQKIAQCNDEQFKYWLDRYKYFDRYPQYGQIHYRQQAELHLQEWEQRLSQHTYLLGDKLSVADLIVLPFVRQLAGVDAVWFAQCQYRHVRQWLNDYLQSQDFINIMHKWPAWQASDSVTMWPNDQA